MKDGGWGWGVEDRSSGPHAWPSVAILVHARGDYGSLASGLTDLLPSDLRDIPIIDASPDRDGREVGPGCSIPVDLRGVVLLSVGEPFPVRPVERAERAGILRYAMVGLTLPAFPGDPASRWRAARLIRAAIVRARARSRAEAAHVKSTFGHGGAAVSRRDLLRGLARPRLDLVPALAVDRCGAWRGCRSCLDACPAGALRCEAGSLSLDKPKCTGCGACLPACPTGALDLPGVSSEDLSRRLEALFVPDGEPGGPASILFRCEDRFAGITAERIAMAWPPHLLPLSLPCIEALSPFAILEAIALGAPEVLVLACPPSCGHRRESSQAAMAVRFTQGFLESAGQDALRVRFVDQESGLQVGPVGLRPVKARWRPGGALAPPPEERRAAILRAFLPPSPLAGAMTGEGIPFGLVRLAPADACTLCGACAGPCPTQALRLDEAEGTVRLIYDHGRCVPCGACTSRCPEHILTVGRALDLGLLAAGARVVASDRVLRCRSCGIDLGPARLVRQASAARSGPSGAEDLCGSCRIKGSLWAAPRQSRAPGGDVSRGTDSRISK